MRVSRFTTDDRTDWLETLKRHSCMWEELRAARDERHVCERAAAVLRGFKTGEDTYIGAPDTGYARLFSVQDTPVLDVARRLEQSYTEGLLPLVHDVLDQPFLVPITRFPKELVSLLIASGVQAPTAVLPRDGYRGHRRTEEGVPCFTYAPNAPLARELHRMLDAA